MRYPILGCISAIAFLSGTSAVARAQHSDVMQLDRLVVQQNAETLAKREAAIAERIARENADEVEADDFSDAGTAAGAAAEAAAEAASIAEALSEVATAIDGDEVEDTSDYFALMPEKLSEWASENYSYNSKDNPQLFRFEKLAKVALVDGDLAAAAPKLAQNYAVDPQLMHQFLQVFLTIKIHSYALDNNPAYAGYRDALIDTFRAFDHADFAVVAAVDALSSVQDCQTNDWDAIMEGATNRVRTAWLVANTDECSDGFVRFLEAAPSHAMPMMIEMAHYGTIESAGSLPIYEWLTRKASFARIAAHNRQWLEATLRRRHLNELLLVGMNQRALELVDSLSDGQLAAVLNPSARSFVAEVDGLPVYVEHDKQTVNLKTNLAAVYALAGRKEEALSLFSNLPRLEEMRAWFSCQIENRTEPSEICNYEHDRPTELLLLDHRFNSPDADPYPLAEALFSTSLSGSPSGAMSEVRCQLFADDQFSDICANSRRQVASNLNAHLSGYNKANHSAGMAAITKLGLQGWADIASRYNELIAKRIEEAGGSPDTRRYERGSIDPMPSLFAERSLPKDIKPIEPEEKEWPTDWKQLPRGFFPVRWERHGGEITVVSVSQIYDPSGEISMGGYWVHLSNDGGKDWQESLYTGLSEFFPYSARRASNLPLRDGDRIALEVSIKQIDTASITYPPIGLRTKRGQDGRYLDIPLEALREDKDGDGMSDIVESHLLLDRKNMDAPAILGTIGGTDCSSSPSREKLARIAILRELFKIESRPIIEPLNRSNDNPLSIGNWRTSENSPAAPLFLKGNPANFSCMSSDRLVIIYNDKHVQALQRHTPDFRTIELPQIIWNRSQDRGYVKWSAGWTGGTLRLIWNSDDWEVTQISSWIT